MSSGSRSNNTILLDKIIGDYLVAIDEGRQPDREAIKKKYPELSERIQEFFDDFDRAPEAFVATGVPTATQDDPHQAGMTIGPYRLVEKLGEGGMGSVWKAEQQHPIQRDVAIKYGRRATDNPNYGRRATDVTSYGRRATDITNYGRRATDIPLNR